MPGLCVSEFNADVSFQFPNKTQGDVVLFHDRYLVTGHRA